VDAYSINFAGNFDIHMAWEELYHSLTGVEDRSLHLARTKPNYDAAFKLYRQMLEGVLLDDFSRQIAKILTN
jgi:hypothetical protein